MRALARTAPALVWVSALVPVAALSAQGPAGQGLAAPEGAPTAAADVTFSRDIAPILQANCQICHRPGDPSVRCRCSTYRDTRRWASRMRELVSQRLMPPFHLDTGRRHPGHQG